MSDFAKNEGLKLRLLTDRWFMLGLTVLLANDLVLKYQFGGLITGKLSDISGLFIFPFFWSILFERQRLAVYTLTGFAFIFWKLPISTQPIDFTNEILGTQFHRVVDYTDLIALLVMPFSHQHFSTRIRTYEQKSIRPTVSAVAIALISVFAFVATSLPRITVPTGLPLKASYYVNVGKRDIFTKRLLPSTSLSDSLEANMVDSLFFLDFWSEGVALHTKVKIYEVEPEKTRIDLVSLESYTAMGGLFFSHIDKKVKMMEKITEEDIKAMFEKDAIEAIETARRRKASIYFWNPRLDGRAYERH